MNIAAQFKQMDRKLDKLGSRWGIRTEVVIREMLATIIEGTYGGKVEERYINDEQFDVVISNGDHILAEVMASVSRKDVKRFERERDLYTREVQAPARFIVATAHIHPKQYQRLLDSGFEVVTPDDEE